MSYQTGILEALKDWGLTVHEVPGWQTRGSSLFDPKGHIFHHDVVPDAPGTDDDIPGIIVAGRSDLPGPLANFWLETDGDVHLCAAGRANHAGEGGWNGLSGNASVWGTEMNNLGIPSDTWPEVQLDAAVRLAACTAEFSGFPVANVAGHKEWAPTRKIDPHTIDMDAFRRQVELQEKELFTMADIDRLVAAQRETTKAVRNQARITQQVIRNQHALDRRQAARLAGDHSAEREADKDASEAEAEIDKLVTREKALATEAEA